MDGSAKPRITIKSYLKKPDGSIVAEEEGFEPPEPFRAQRFSRPPHSTTLPLLRRKRCLWEGAPDGKSLRGVRR